MKLPKEISQDVTSRLHNEVKFALRALADIDGNLGEAHVVTDGQDLLIYSRKLGDTLKTFELHLNDLKALDLEDDRPFAFLKIASDSASYRLKFGGMDSDALKQLIELWRQNCTEERAPGEPSAVPRVAVELDPFVAFCAALYSMMEVDGSVDSEETHQLKRMIGRSEVITSAIGYLRQHGLEAVLKQLPTLLNREQSLCLLANLIEIAMVDGYLRGSEQALLERYRAVLDLDAHDQDALYDVLSIKNNLAVFTL